MLTPKSQQYALDAMDPHNIKVGDTFVLCDAGGGTVDLISYMVSALKPILQIAEAAPGSGSSCGSTFLNRIFQKFITDKLRKDPNWDEEVLEEVYHIPALTRRWLTIAAGHKAVRDDGTRITCSVYILKTNYHLLGQAIFQRLARGGISDSR